MTVPFTICPSLDSVSYLFLVPFFRNVQAKGCFLKRLT